MVNFKTDKYWLNIGIGSFNTFKYSGGLHESIDINLVQKNTLYKVQYQYNDELKILSSKLPIENLHSFNILMGKQFVSNDDLYIRLAGGLGVFTGNLRGERILKKTTGWFSQTTYDDEKITTLSIPLEAELALVPIKYAQLALNVFGNVNLKRPLYGLAIKVGVGKIK
ncbi:hypothetical protein [Pseudopedobacter beijingensis]|uniref:Outer membrane protein beta-barrel domain-containing protein n=1 Tax=Pseudopedobacter beijingensis TaxID=1207056 RepID=A0ABW4IGH2_9SPHI